MTKDEAIKYLIRPVSTSTVPSKEIEKQFQAYEMAIEALKQNPTTHAHWLKINNPNYSPFDQSSEYYLFCSNCECGHVQMYNFCPSCGAKMDEG